MNQPELILDFTKIKEQLCEHASSDSAKQRLMALSPLLSERACNLRMEETTQARRLLEQIGSPPLAAMKELETVLTLCEKGSMLVPEQLEHIAVFLAACARMKQYLKRAEPLQIPLAGYGHSIFDLADLRAEIERSIQGGAVQDAASTDLRDIRRRIDNIGVQVKQKLEELLRGKKSMFSEQFVSIRNGRHALPVKKEYKNQIRGTVVDISGSGGTYFIEPAAATKLLDELSDLRIEEENEICKILYILTALVEDASSLLTCNQEAMVTLDVLFAKGKLSLQMDAIPVPVNSSRQMTIVQGRHPLISKEQCVPLDFSIGGATRGVVITGPNTGGKTVALKTVGLLSMMAQSGLHIPVESGCLCMHNCVLCDIGDGQSITENLSTFSAHITNIIDLLDRADQESLVLLDELGSGTDPAEGMGIAIAILEELRVKGCLFIATTHYPEVKDYAAQAQGLCNARMAFDRESLQPLYRLELGEAGESCALYIAKRLGFPVHLLARAQQEAYRTRPRQTEGVVSPPDDVFAAADMVGADSSLPAVEVNGIRAAKARSTPKIVKDLSRPVLESRVTAYQLGDSVTVSPEDKIGLVFQPADSKGMVGVQIQGEKHWINYKRLHLKTPASELYPPDYDFSIVFDSVENRKARHQMDKKHVPGLVVEPLSFQE